MFTNNWFQITAIKNFEKYIATTKGDDSVKNFLEIGCYEGQASVWMMENTEADLTVIDTFKGSKEHDAQFESTLLDRFLKNIEPYKVRVSAMVGLSQTRLKELHREGKLFDFIYIDGSHQASDVLEDAVLAFPLLKKYGIMIFDDYTWGQGMAFYDIPQPGIDAFLSIYGNQLEVLEKNSQVIIRKK
ncbi:MAG: class I SAM-dependent methyltransferase [Candidatus Peribacteraceae bacterium]|nr:class I SAM-dependent methyltransferase [Candidatus Peribacteraceae bacterium]